MIDSLQSDGFMVLPTVLTPARSDNLAAAIGRLNPTHGLRNLLQNCPAVAALAEELEVFANPVLGAEAFPVRGLFFDKVPGANWEVGWHQDLSIAVAERLETPDFTGWSVKQGVPHVQPPADILETMLTVRLHLDDCGENNGPLRVLRGSHREGRLSGQQIEDWKRCGKEVSCVVPKGGVLLMRPLLLHSSSRAKEPTHRRVIHLEFATKPLPGKLRWFEQASHGMAWQ